jgi:hypothetical protein
MDCPIEVVGQAGGVQEILTARSAQSSAMSLLSNGRETDIRRRCEHAVGVSGSGGDTPQQLSQASRQSTPSHTLPRRRDRPVCASAQPLQAVQSHGLYEIRVLFVDRLSINRCYFRWRIAGGVAFEHCPQSQVVAVARLEFDAGKQGTVGGRQGVDPRRDVLRQPWVGFRGSRRRC